MHALNYKVAAWSYKLRTNINSDNRTKSLIARMFSASMSVCIWVRKQMFLPNEYRVSFFLFFIPRSETAAAQNKGDICHIGKEEEEPERAVYSSSSSSSSSRKSS
jgi:hypothetical protein